MVRVVVCWCRMQEVNQQWFQSEFIKANVNKVSQVVTHSLLFLDLHQFTKSFLWGVMMS